MGSVNDLKNPSNNTDVDKLGMDKLKTIPPLSNVIIEVASFDTQKMQNPEI
jgi:hypothetical protein